MVLQNVAIDDVTTVQIVEMQVAGDVEVFYDLRSKDATIFYGDVEIECKMTASVLASLNDLDIKSTLRDKILTLQRIERLSKRGNLDA